MPSVQHPPYRRVPLWKLIPVCVGIVLLAIPYLCLTFTLWVLRVIVYLSGKLWAYMDNRENRR